MSDRDKHVYQSPDPRPVEMRSKYGEGRGWKGEDERKEAAFWPQSIHFRIFSLSPFFADSAG